jgi:hypothetical protein
LARHGISLRLDRLQDRHRVVTDSIADPRPLRTTPGSLFDVRQTTRDLGHALDLLERWLAGAH